MSYSYTIESSYYSPNGTEITEYLDDQFNDLWFVIVLKYGCMEDFPASFDSFERTRNWVMENHPELMI